MNEKNIYIYIKEYVWIWKQTKTEKKKLIF